MTIDRAIEILDPEHRENYDGMDEVNEACRMGMEALKQQRWIPCSVRLPENGENALVWDKLSRDVFIGRYYECDGWEIDGYYGDYSWDITHWMPLPEPPESGLCSYGQAPMNQEER
jgi:hypothetical protein